MFALGDAQVTERLTGRWGEVRDTAPKKQRAARPLQGDAHARLPQERRPRQRPAGLQQDCQQCHKLFGEGGTIGPDLTGSNRSNLDYLLSNLIDPSAEVGRDYRMSMVSTDDGRVITGIVVERTAGPRRRADGDGADDRARRRRRDDQGLAVSIMPEGQLDALTREQVRDLIAYLNGSCAGSDAGQSEEIVVVVVDGVRQAVPRYQLAMGLDL